MTHFINFDQQLGTTPNIETNEKVVTKQTVADGSLYAGYILGLADNQLLGNSDPVYGIFSGAGRTGTQYEVIKEGVPSAGQILWDQSTGRIVSASAGTFYVNYLFYARLFRFWERGDLTVSYSGLVSTGSDIVIYNQVLQYPERFTGFSIQVPNDPLGDVTVKINKNGSLAQSITALASGDVSKYKELNWFNFAANDVLQIVINASNTLFVMDPIVALRRG